MPRSNRMVPWMVLVLAPGLAGCHLTKRVAPEDGPAPPTTGRTEQAFIAPLRPTLTAVLGALDDAQVKPEKLIIHGASTETGKQPALAIEPAEANMAMLPDGTRADDIFVRHQLALPGTPPTAFVPIFVTYQGKASDGRAVGLTIATKRGDEANNLVTVKLGHRSDPAASQALLDKVAARLDLKPESAPPNPTQPR